MGNLTIMLDDLTKMAYPTKMKEITLSILICSKKDSYSDENLKIIVLFLKFHIFDPYKWHTTQFA